MSDYTHTFCIRLFNPQEQICDLLTAMRKFQVKKSLSHSKIIKLHLVVRNLFEKKRFQGVTVMRPHLGKREGGGVNQKRVWEYHIIFCLETAH